MSEQTPPAGWYPDQQGTMRWWDGQSWTAHTAQPQAGAPQPGHPSASDPAQAQAPWQPPQYGAVQPVSGPTTWKIVVGCILVLLALVSLSGSGEQTYANTAERLGALSVPVLLGGGGVWLIVAGTRGKKAP